MIKRRCVMILLMLAAPGSLYARQSSDKTPPGAQTVEQLIIRGNRRYPLSTIESWITIREGDAYRPEQPNRDVRALFETGHFDDVKVYVEDGTRGGKVITFEVREKSLIAAIEYEGIGEDKQAQIADEWRRQKIELAAGSEYDPVVVRRAARVIQDWLVRDADTNLRVGAFVKVEVPTEVIIIFKVE
jgi:outer membrane protein insertion porin family